MAKKRVGKFPKAFRQMAVDRLAQCERTEPLVLGFSNGGVAHWFSDDVHMLLEARSALGRPELAGERLLSLRVGLV